MLLASIVFSTLYHLNQVKLMNMPVSLCFIDLQRSCLLWKTVENRRWVSAPSKSIFDGTGMFHIVLCALCFLCVVTIPVLSLLHARENTNCVIIYPFSSKIHIFNPILCFNKKVNMCQYPDILCVHLNNNTLFVKRQYKNMGSVWNLSNGDHGQGRIFGTITTCILYCTSPMYAHIRCKLQMDFSPNLCIRHFLSEM